MRLIGIISVAVLALASGPAWSGESAANGTPPGPSANGSCLLPPSQLAAPAVSAFVADPATFLKDYPAGGAAMIIKVRALAGSSADTVDLLIALNSEASPMQRRALGIGLSEAANACTKMHPVQAADIRKKVSKLGAGDLLTAFLDTESRLAGLLLAPVAVPDATASNEAVADGSNAQQGHAASSQGPTSFAAFTGVGGGTTVSNDVSPVTF